MTPHQRFNMSASTKASVINLIILI